MTMPQPDLKDPALVTEVDLARAAAQEVAGDEPVGAHVDTHIDDEAAVTHLFEADKQGYGGWCWAVTIASAGPEFEATVSEVVLLPGSDALVAPEWVPWQERVQAGDLGVGDLMPTDPDDPRLVPAYLASDDPAVEEIAVEAGLGRVRVMAREARLDAATRWQQSEFGPRSDMARSAPAHCGTCGFYLPLAGALQAAFGTCGNEISPADGHVVHTEYGCGAHSEAEVEQVSPVLVADLIYDDAQLDVEPLAEPEEPTAEAALVTEAPEIDEQPEEAPTAESAPAVDPVETAEPEAPAAAVLSEEAPAAEPTCTADAVAAVETVQPEAPIGDVQPEFAPEEVPAAESVAVEAAEPAGDVLAEESPAAESLVSEPVEATPAVVETAEPEAPIGEVQPESASVEAPAADVLPEEAPPAEWAVTEAAEPTSTADAVAAVETVEPEAPAGGVEPDAEVTATESVAVEAAEPAGDVLPEEAPAAEPTTVLESEPVAAPEPTTAVEFESESAPVVEPEKPAVVETEPAPGEEAAPGGQVAETEFPTRPSTPPGG